METLELTARGLVLRPWCSQDAPAVFDALREPEIARWNPQGDIPDLAAAREWIRRRADPSTGVSYAVTDGTGLLGSVSLRRMGADYATIGYWTVAAARGRGVATRAVARLAEWGFAEDGLHRIELCHAVANAASCRVAQRAGFTLEGTLRESYRFGDGHRHDEHLHARLATDPRPA
ncbi:GNAT family N-acetyltransferase [Micromonospora sp. WMMA1363]|uniref:GNAT family N-acetyltransferase n=1 Tax=Micromonospora sp. WMMA1363 TaxID=3053985 RepID=UPI00259D29E4|nr:GNAT family N-acetyltransferase [Micromonospora sp. WMMA1363]MDM4718369.1 GNAT family N-acetyltransferase [Micromonospora sp. WMMA1363]